MATYLSLLLFLTVGSVRVPRCERNKMASEQQRLPTRERRPSMGAPIVDIQGAVAPAGISRPKHTRTATGFGPGEIKTVEGMYPLQMSLILELYERFCCLNGSWLLR